MVSPRRGAAQYESTLKRRRKQPGAPIHNECHSGRQIELGTEMRQWTRCTGCRRSQHATYTLRIVSTTRGPERRYVTLCDRCGRVMSVDGPGATTTPDAGHAA